MRVLLLLRMPKRQVRVAALASVVVALGAGAGVAAQTDLRLRGDGSSAQEALTVPALPHESGLDFEQHPEERLKARVSRPTTTEPVAVLAIAEPLEDQALPGSPRPGEQGQQAEQGPPPQGEQGQQGEQVQQGEQGQEEQGEAAQASPPLVAQDPSQLLLSPGERAALALIQQIIQEQEGVLMGSGFDYIVAGRRDPFTSLLVQIGAVTLSGVRPPGLAGLLVSEVDLKGVATSNGRWYAMIIGIDQRAYFLEVGTELFDGHVVEIRSDEVLFEQVVLDALGARRTREVTKRLRTTAGGGETR